MGNVIYIPRKLSPLGALILTWDDIANVPVADATSVSDWNTFFDLPTNGTAFTSVVVTGTEVNLIGGSNITIKDSLFFGNLNLIVVNDTIGSIVHANNYAFTSCNNMTILNLPNIETAGESCFASTVGTNYSLPKLNTAGNACFQGCIAMTNIDLPSLEFAGISCFQGCTNITEINLPNIETISDFCFADCYSITEIELPSLITITGESAFQSTAITSFSFPNLIFAGNYAFIETVASTYNFPLLETIGSSCFQYCVNITSLYIPSCTNLGVSTSYDDVFYGITGQTITLTIPSALMTCFEGGPDYDIQDLQANNTVTVITV